MVSSFLVGVVCGGLVWLLPAAVLWRWLWKAENRVEFLEAECEEMAGFAMRMEGRAMMADMEEDGDDLDGDYKRGG